MIIKKRLSWERIKVMVKSLSQDKKVSPDYFERGMKEHGWHLIVSLCYQVDELEKKLKREIRLREQADELIRKLKK